MPEAKSGTDAKLGAKVVDRRLVGALFLGLLILGLIPLLAGLIWNRSLAQKGLTEFAMPIGFVWCILWLGIWWSWGRRQSWKVATLWLMAWLAWTLVGNRHIASRFSAWHESEYSDRMPEGDYDAVIVLGGGVAVDSLGRVGISEDGQRAIFAVQLYYRKQAKRLIATGSKIEGYSSDAVDPKDATSRLFTELGVPEDAIIRLPGINTSQELQSIREYLSSPDQKEWRVGLITSAFHMPRAMRLAKSQDLELEPLPTAFRSNHATEYTPLDLIPSNGAIDRNGRLIKELLAKLVGR